MAATTRAQQEPEDEEAAEETSAESASGANDCSEEEEMNAKKVRASFNAPAHWMILAGMTLAACAGMVNVTMSLEMGAVVTHTTGHLTNVGLRLEGVRIGYFSDVNWTEVEEHTDSKLTAEELGEHIDALQQALLVIGSFIFGAFLCGLVIPKNALKFGGKSFYGVALLGNSCLLTCGLFAALARQWLLAEAVTACASGLQNAMCTMHLGAVVRTTHVTGTSTDIGSTLGRASMILLRRRCNRRRMTHVERAEVDVDLDKMSVLVAIFFSFLMGCFLGALLFSHVGIYTLIVPAGTTGLMGILYTCFRQSMKRAIKKFEVKHMEEEIVEVSDLVERLRSRTVVASATLGPSTSSRSIQEEQQDEEDLDHVVEMLHELQEAVQELTERSHSHSSYSSEDRAAKARSRHVAAR